MIPDTIQAYLRLFPVEHDALQGLQQQVARGAVLNNRRTLPGHITGSALVLSADSSQILLIHHKLFDKWLQPGGHWDPEDATPRDAAQREVEEETGVQIARQLEISAGEPLIPLDIGVHPIAARPDVAEPAHTHYDFRYLFVARSASLTHAQREVYAAEWVSLEDTRTEHIRDCIEKLYRFGFAQKP